VNRLAWYVDEEAWQDRPSGDRAVLLVGGYQGFANFGDVLQLKGVVRWHRQVSGLEPIVVLSTTSIADRGFHVRLRSWLGVRQLVYWSERPLDVEAVGLTELRRAPAIGHLQVFGGECLASRWLGVFLTLIESTHARFGVGHYVLSGQQADRAAIPRLREHFNRHPPIVAGGRDPESAEHIAAAGAPAAYSFDDALEPLDQLVAEATDHQGLEPKPADALIHLNTSDYTATGGNRNGQPATSLAGDLETLARAVARSEPERADVVVLQAFDDRRVDEISDSLGTIVELEDGFPFPAYRVVDLARLALELARRPVAATLPSSARLAYTCSYHVTLLCTMLGIPCFLRAKNPFYRQKRAALGLSAGTLPEFLRCPEAPTLERQRRAREDWLKRLQAAYGAPRAVARRPARGTPPDGSVAPLEPKPGIAALRSRLRRGQPSDGRTR
jgi:hypothetical protein